MTVLAIDEFAAEIKKIVESGEVPSPFALIAMKTVLEMQNKVESLYSQLIERGEVLLEMSNRLTASTQRAINLTKQLIEETRHGED